MHLVTTGSTYLAKHALLSDLFTEVLPSADAVLPRALQLAEEIAKNTSVVSFALMRDLMYRGPDSAEAAHLLDSKVIFDLFRGGDNKEGVAAFLEKRNVDFKGTMGKDAPEAWPWWEFVDTRNRAKAAKDSKL